MKIRYCACKSKHLAWGRHRAANTPRQIAAVNGLACGYGPKKAIFFVYHDFFFNGTEK
jgi:hypothetical protein